MKTHLQILVALTAALTSVGHSQVSVVAGPESFSENWRKCSLEDCTVGGLDAAADSEGQIYVLDLVAADVRVMARKKDVPVASGGTNGA